MLHVLIISQSNKIVEPLRLVETFCRNFLEITQRGYRQLFALKFDTVMDECSAFKVSLEIGSGLRIRVRD